jgi:hypothetical protein
MSARRGLALDAAMHPATRAYCDFLLAVSYSGYPAQITAIWALKRTYLESWSNPQCAQAIELSSAPAALGQQRRDLVERARRYKVGVDVARGPRHR